MIAQIDMQEFSGQGGCFASMCARSARSTFLSMMPGVQSLLREDLHVTLVYSKETPPALALSGIALQLAATCNPHITEVCWIAGHDKRGYLVARLSPQDLIHRQELLLRIGCTTPWPVFFPHVTLASDLGIQTAAPHIENARRYLSNKTTKLALRGIVCRDLW